MVMRVPRLRRLMCAPWPSLLACVGCASYPALGDPLVVPDPGPPSITALGLSCDNEAGRWRLEVETDAWTSGGELIWTVDGSYVERFGGLRSVQAQADGHGDTLRLDINIVEDWRQTGDGGPTAFVCSADVTAFIYVADLRGEVTDCRSVGPNAVVLAAVSGTPPCTTPWVDPADPPMAGNDDTATSAEASLL